MAYLTNEDFCGFTSGRTEAQMTADELVKQMAFYAGDGGNTTIININAQKAYFDSKVWESVMSGLEFQEDGSVFFRGKKLANGMHPALLTAKNTKILFENVKDPTALRIAAGREYGSKVFLSIRMNDVHQVDNVDSVLVSDFWREHPEYQTIPYARKGFWFGHTFNYAIREVYDYALALAREMLTRFLPDGFELDWMRSPYYFEPGTELENAHILTEFTRDVRAIADECEQKSGHGIELIARIPTRPQEALRMGFDVPAWCRKGLITRVIPSPYFGTVDYDIPLETWRALLGPEIKITPALECYMRERDLTSPILTTPEIDFGFAASFYYRGADDIYLFNHMDHEERASHTSWRDKIRFIQSVVGDRKKVEAQKRRHLVTYSEPLTHPVGSPADGILPLEVMKKGYYPPCIRLNVGGGTTGRQARIVLSCVEQFPEAVLCNGKECTSDGIQTEVKNTALAENTIAFDQQYNAEVKNIMTWEIPANALKDGDNILYFIGDCTIIWCEIDIDAAESGQW